MQVLFVCVHNAGRSQMVEAFFNALAPQGLRAASAGVAPVQPISPGAMEAMVNAG